MKVLGYKLAILELFIFYIFSNKFLNTYSNLQIINTISYYWYMFTILTGIWEFYYVFKKKNVRKYSLSLLLNKKHVWTEKYNIYNINLSNFSQLFYSEYAAYADREYLQIKDNWSNLIEGTHCLLCGSLSFIAIVSKLLNNNNLFLIFASISMGSQLMNSILYIGEYFIQIKDSHNINYNSNKFPIGFMLYKRPFFYINIFWTIMPIFNIYNLIYNNI